MLPLLGRPGVRALILSFAFLSLPACARKEASPAAPADATPPSVGSAARAEPPAERPAERASVPPATQRACADICTRSRELQCKNAGQCMPNCMAMAALTPCAEPITVLYQCLVSQPLKHWECDPDGIAAIREGFCDPQQKKAVACMEAKMQ